MKVRSSSITLVAPLVATLAIAACNAGGSPNVPEKVGQPPLERSAGAAVAQFAYVANYGSNNVSAYTINASTGALTQVTGSPFGAGTQAYDVAIDPNGKFVYVTNYGSNNVSAYTVNATSGALTQVAGSPFSRHPVTRHCSRSHRQVPLRDQLWLQKRFRVYDRLKQRRTNARYRVAL